MNNVVNINGKAVERIEYKGMPIVTLPMVDDLHERPKGSARVTFNRHKKRMVEGEDFFVVPFEEWKPLISVCERYADTQKSSSKYGGDMTFLTETGYLMLVKVFDDDLSWQIQRMLVRHYFAAVTESGPDRRVDVNMKHTRGITNPNGLDIRFTLDITKICTKPTRPGLLILERLTGVSMKDMIDELHATGTVATATAVIVAFSKDHLKETQGARAEIARVYAAYLAFCGERSLRPLSKLCFGRELKSLFPGIIEAKSVGTSQRVNCYGNLELLEESGSC
ncbi:MAG TPA: ORF6N domain-containing protein [Geobacteraceae bacterium]|nr:ORF6N domain-containing protein [Geobacteraceae bacterium]